MSRWALALVGIGTLASCGAGTDNIPDFVAYDDPRNEELANLYYGATNIGYTDPRYLIAFGTAVYSGVVAFDANPGVFDNDSGTNDMVGDLDVTVRFASTDSLEGRASNFVSVRGESYDGELLLTNGRLDRNADLSQFYTYGFDLTGTLEADGRPASSVFLSLGGDFYGYDSFGLAYMAGDGLFDQDVSRSTFCENAAAQSTCGPIPWAAFATELVVPPDV